MSVSVIARSRKGKNALRVLLHDFCRESNEHANGVRTPQYSADSLVPTQLLDHLCNSHSVTLSNEIQEAKGVILGDGARALNGLVTSILLPVALNCTGRSFRVDGFLGFVRPAFDDVSGNGVEVVGGDESC